MKRAITALALSLSCAAAAVACGSQPGLELSTTTSASPSPPPSASSSSSRVQSSVAPPTAKKSGGPPTRCGEVVYANNCPEDRHPKFECFIHALEECTPATLRIKKTTIEGGKVIHDFAVIRTSKGECVVEAQYDERADKFGGKASVTTTRCKSVKPLGMAGCTTLGMDGC